MASPGRITKIEEYRDLVLDKDVMRVYTEPVPADGSEKITIVDLSAGPTEADIMDEVSLDTNFVLV